MEDILKKIVGQLRADKKAFDVCFEDDESLAPTLTRVQRGHLEVIYAYNTTLTRDLERLQSILRGIK